MQLNIARSCRRLVVNAIRSAFLLIGLASIVPSFAAEYIVNVVGERLPKTEVSSQGPEAEGNSWIGWSPSGTTSGGPGRSNLQKLTGQTPAKAELIPVEGNAPPLTCDQQESSPSTPNPVIIATGEKYQREADFKDFSLVGLSQNRTYKSLPSNRPARLFGSNWFSTFDFPRLLKSAETVTDEGYPALGKQPRYITMTLPDGETVKYEYSGYP